MAYLQGKLEDNKIVSFTGNINDISKEELEGFLKNTNYQNGSWLIEHKDSHFRLEIDYPLFFLFDLPYYQEFRENKNKLRFYEKLMKNSHDMFCVIDENGVEKYINEAVTRITGYTPQEVIGKNGFQFIHPEDLPYLYKKLEEYREKFGEFIKVEYRHQHKNGNWLYLEAIAQNFLHDPDLQGITMNVRDITENKILQEQIIKAEKLAIMGKLISGIAHDFNNYLTIILAYCEVLENKTSLTPIQKQYIDNIKKSAQVTTHFIKELLSLVKKNIEKTENINIHDLIQQVIVLASHTLDRNIELKNTLKAKNIYIKGDKNQIESALLNIIINARDAIKSDPSYINGWIHIETDNVILNEKDLSAEYQNIKIKDGQYLKISISNSGPKIDPQIKEEVFQPFFTTKEKGTGMGLYAAYTTMKEHNGYIFIEDNLPHTTFSLYFPLGENENLIIEGENDGNLYELDLEKSPLSGKKVFVLDDESMIVDIIREFLSSINVSVFSAQNPSDAIEVLKTQEFDLHIFDYNMPEMNGIALIKKLKEKNYNLKNILFISGQKIPEEDLSYIQQLDAKVKFLQKPFHFKELIDSIKSFYF